jgi:hypothetical protein
VNLNRRGYDLIGVIFAVAAIFSAALVPVNLQAQKDQQTSNETLDIQESGEGKGETFIVTLKNQTSSADLDELTKLVEDKGAEVTHVYSHSIMGFSVQIPADKKTEIMYSLVSDMRVSGIEPDQTMSLSPPLE